MLKLKNITRTYKTADMEVQALKGISLCFRKSEFVSILGPSGCGKTTTLNIIGGLDHYTDGNLIIGGISTKEFNDHDWDVYRNHKIGFIFQSYNLIPHENIQENVELALTISGVGKEEREKKAREALDKVGLKGLYSKKPNELSGGQCQRVAIARALVNKPDILLADEPTGALDSITSVQIMDLIKEISNEKLVIMVTHNPELANRYSTRIINLLDGQVVHDSMPYSEEDEAKEYLDVKEKTEEELQKEKAKMSWFTAFRLSGRNLWSKAKRTVLTVIAASIGIVGVSAVLSIRGGVTDYIDGMQDEMLSGNPISVQSNTFDLSSILSQMNLSTEASNVKESIEDGYVNVDFLTKRLIDSAKSMGTAMIQNDITEDYIHYIEKMPDSYYQEISYSYGIDVSNNIYTSETRDDPSLKQDEITETYSLSGIRSIATSVLKEKLSQTGYGSYGSMIETFSSDFMQSLNDSDYLLSQYDVVEGKVAKEADEIMVVLDENQAITDFLLTLLGYYSQSDFLNVVYHYNTDESGNHDPNWSEKTEEAYEKKKKLAFDGIMKKKFTYYPNNTVYSRNQGSDMMTKPFNYSYKENEAWTDGFDLKVVGILKPKKNRQYSSLRPGFYYTPAFTKKFIEDNQESFFTDYVRNHTDSTSSSDGTLSSGEIRVGTSNDVIRMGVYYTFDYKLEGKVYKDNYGYLGSKNNSFSSLFASISGSGSMSTITTRNLGGVSLPSSIYFYPNSFEDKYLVTDYLDRWNQDGVIVANGKEIKKEDREEIKYTDNLSVIIQMINNVINMISIALISFTALSLVVSTVMIAIITYVSVMERIKEIGIIRALGGRKKDVSHLFNAETLIIGASSGIFGISVTYLIQLILNLIIRSMFPAIGSIANLSFVSALVIILISILLTTVAGLIPASNAARKDPVLALRSE